MTRVLLLVEGQTEEAFVNRVLAPHLLPFQVYVERASMLRTKELPIGSPHKGGVTTFARMQRDAERLLNDSDAFVTTIIDLYGLPHDFPELSSARALSSARQRALALQAAFADAIRHPRFKPFLALHEFEAWVFAAPDIAEAHLDIPGLGPRLAAVAAEAGGPEAINHGPTTHPAMRLDHLVRTAQRTYGKVQDGPEILAKSGLAVVRATCPHFHDWLTWLESLGGGQATTA